MKNTSYIIIACAALLIVFTHACNKDGGIETIKLNEPFYATPGKRYVMNESAMDSATGNSVPHTITIKCTSVTDYRCFVSEGLNGCCPNSSGGRADIVIEMSKNDEAAVSSELSFPGCTQGEEYDTINIHIPTAHIYMYKVGLLKLDPWNNKGKKEKDYSVKLIVRKR